MNHEHPTLNNFQLQWFLATLTGFLLSLFWIEIGEKPDIGFSEGAIGGAILGLVQFLALKPQLARSRWWILSSVLTWALIAGCGLGAVGWAAPRTAYLPLRLIYGAIDGARIGLLISIGQWWVLRQAVPAAWRWLAASSLSWGFSLAIGWVIGGLLRLATHLFLSEVIGLAVTWAIVGATTGLVLKNLLQEASQTKLAESAE